VKDIENSGSPNNVDAAPNENNLIDFAKKQEEGFTRKERNLLHRLVKD